MPYLRNIFLVVLLGAVCATNARAQEAESSMTEPQLLLSGKVKQPQQSYNFGTIKEENGYVSHVFKVKNISRDTLRIVRYDVFCGCTDLSYNRKQIPPGQSACVSVSFNPTYRPGSFDREAYLYIDTDSTYVSFRITGEVLPSPYQQDFSVPHALGGGLYVSQQEFYLLDKKVGEELSFTLKVLNQGNRKMTIDFLLDAVAKQGVALSAPLHVALEPQESKEIPIIITQPASHEGFVTLPIRINGRKGKPLQVRWFTTL